MSANTNNKILSLLFTVHSFRPFEGPNQDFVDTVFLECIQTRKTQQKLNMTEMI